MATSCIYCETIDNLNTRLDIMLEDGSKATVHVCDKHAEEASIKTAKALYVKRQTQINELLEQAKKLGLELVPTASGLVVAHQQVSKQPQLTQQRQLVAQEQETDNQMVDTALVDRRDRGMVSVGGDVSGFSVPSHRQHSLEEVRDKLPEGALQGKVKMEIAEGRAGMPVAIPARRVDGTGITSIRIVQISDAELQKRFKNVADMSKSPVGWEHQPDFRHGYDVRPCPLCRGEAVVRNRGKEIECPKCKGRGTL